MIPCFVRVPEGSTEGGADVRRADRADAVARARRLRRIQWALVVVLGVVVSAEAAYLISRQPRLDDIPPQIPNETPPGAPTVEIDPAEVRPDLALAVPPPNQFGDGLYVRSVPGDAVTGVEDTRRDAVLAALDGFVTREAIGDEQADALRSVVGHSERFIEALPVREAAGEIGAVARADLQRLELSRQHLEVEKILGADLAGSLRRDLEAAREGG